MIPWLHLIKLRRHHTVRYLGYTVLTLQLILLVGGGKNGEYGFFARVPLQVRHHGILRCRAVTLRLRHLRLGFHGAELENPLRFGFVQIEMLLSVEQRLAHVDLICAVVPGRVEIEFDLPLVLRLRVAGGEVIVGLESLVMRVGGLHVRSLALEVEVDETFQLLVHVVHRKKHLRCTLQVRIGVVERRILCLSASY
jgi:hypothetical protein